jgi:D-2-hydroxyacid dehydrogenase (NADP+)
MSTNILVICPQPDPYVARLQPLFPDIRFTAVASLECAPDTNGLAEADAIFGYGRGFDAACLARAARLKWYQCLITGTDHLAPVLRGSDVILTNARGIHGAQMAETAVLHMLALSRNVAQMVRNQDAHVWDRISPRVLDRRTAVILGVGSIAEQVARVCKSFGMRTIGLSRTPREIEGFDEIRARGELVTAAREADFLIVLAPLSADTHHIIGRDVLSAMKPSAFVVNIARGGVVDEAALLRALDEGGIAGAGLDVFEDTPLPASSPFWGRKNVFITPFIGGHSDRYAENALTIVEPNLRCFLTGELERMINRVSL